MLFFSISSVSSQSLNDFEDSCDILDNKVKSNALSGSLSTKTSTLSATTKAKTSTLSATTKAKSNVKVTNTSKTTSAKKANTIVNIYNLRFFNNKINVRSIRFRIWNVSLILQ